MEELQYKLLRGSRTAIDDDCGCPHIPENGLIGSVNCQNCKYNKGTSKSNKAVKCSFKDDVHLKFEGKITAFNPENFTPQQATGFIVGQLVLVLIEKGIPEEKAKGMAYPMLKKAAGTL